MRADFSAVLAYTTFPCATEFISQGSKTNFGKKKREGNNDNKTLNNLTPFGTYKKTRYKPGFCRF